MMTMSLDETTATDTATMTIRVVFDGAPFAGKTTAAQSLSEALGGSVTSPEEHEGRTLWFDWMTYSAGHHEGRALRVELVTVPGQVHLAPRRRHLIEWGDVIVFIANTSEAVFADSAARFHDLRREVADDAKPVIVIANKRDLMDALPLDEVTEQLGLGDDDVLIEGVATAGGGIRTAFIHAVRAALEGATDRIDSTTADELLAEMRAALTTVEEPAGATAQPEVTTPDDAMVTRVEFASEGASVAPAEEPAAPPLATASPTPTTPRGVQLNSEAIADGEAVVVFAQHWRTIVDIALGVDVADCDATTIAELVDWGLLCEVDPADADDAADIDQGGADVERLPSDHDTWSSEDAVLPSDDTDVPSPGPAVKSDRLEPTEVASGGTVTF